MTDEKHADPDRETLEALALHMADAIGEAGGAIIARRDKLQSEMVDAWAERDTGRRHLANVLAILDRMGWEPTFVQDGEHVEAARAWATTTGTDEG